MIVGWQKHSFIDFPGTIATVLFFAGCNLRCPYCHNPQIVLNTTGTGIDPAEVTRFLRKRRGQIEGVVFTGGEPTIHPELVTMADGFRREGFRIKLDTNGLFPEVIRAVRPDYLALDIKGDPLDYPRLFGAGVDDCPQRLRRSVSLVREMGERGEVRVTVAPGITTARSIGIIADLVAGVSTVYLQTTQRGVATLDPAFSEIMPEAPEVVASYRDIIASCVGRCRIRGQG